MKPIHGFPKDSIAESLAHHYRGFTTTAPDGVDLRPGDLVEYTNSYGVKFQLTVKGFTAKPDPVSESLNENTVYVFDDCWWFPVNPKWVTLVKRTQEAK